MTYDLAIYVRAVVHGACCHGFREGVEFSSGPNELLIPHSPAYIAPGTFVLLLTQGQIPLVQYQNKLVVYM